MYQRLLKILIVTRDPSFEMILEEVPPLRGFKHQFTRTSEIGDANLLECAVVILDNSANAAESVKKVHAAKGPDAALVVCFNATLLPTLASVYDLIDQVWIRPLNTVQIQSSFKKILQHFKEREDGALNGRYVDALINGLPDLIWFKDKRGAHLKVNDSFCRTVNKPKEQVEGRGHYYIWDIEPDEYAQGEYVCLESENNVLEKKETCLFDETVKCGDSMRKFKTWKSPIFDCDGQVMGTVGFAHDVTDLQNLMIELTILLDGLPFAALVTDADKKITSVNQGFIDTFQTEKNALLNQCIDLFMDATRTYTVDQCWTIERGARGTLMHSGDKTLKIQKETLLDVFGVRAGHIYLFHDITQECHSNNEETVGLYMKRLRNSLACGLAGWSCQVDD